MPKFAANLSMMFTVHPFLDRFDATAPSRGSRCAEPIRGASFRAQTPQACTKLRAMFEGL
jgi:hydroxypyruvate isomerase